MSARIRPRLSPLPLALAFCCLASVPLFAQPEIGAVVGQLRVAHGDAPPERILVSLEIRGATMQSAYADSQGRFSFSPLPINSYYVNINDEHYEPVHAQAVLNPVTQTAVLQITLIPRQSEPKPAEKQLSGSNPNMMDIREYSKDFPKKVVKEFEKGIEADRDNKKSEAIAHYRKAIELAPDFYPAHNNLGSDELSLSHLDAARTEFEKVVKLNLSDANAYFNLANVAILMGQPRDAQNFLDEGFRRQPESPMGKFLLGSLDLRTGKLPEAELALQQAIKLDPTMAQPRLQLVNLFLKEGRKTDAVEQIHAFLTAIPNSPFSGHAKELLHRLEAPSATPALATPAAVKTSAATPN